MFSLSLHLSVYLSLFLSHTHSLTHSLTHTILGLFLVTSITSPPMVSPSLSLSLSPPLTHSLSLSHFLSLSLPLALSLPLSLSLSLSLPLSFLLFLPLPHILLLIVDAQGQPVYMSTGPGGMGVQGQTVDANGMVRRLAYGNVPPQQQYVMANGEQVPPGTHRGQGQQVGMVQGQGQYMNNMMAPQGGPLGSNGMMSGQMAHMGGRAGDLDNGMFQVNPRGDSMGGRSIDIRDRVDVRNGKQQVNFRLNF